MKKRKTEKHPLTGPIPEVMDIQTLARYLALGRSKIYNLIRLKKIPASRIGRQYRFSKTIIDSWLREQVITQDTVKQIPLFTSSGK
ncbi:MAG: helix-turn-helix domain-containing protein [bacterium]